MPKRKIIEINQFLEGLENVRSENRKAYNHIENARNCAKVSDMHKHLENARRICRRTHESIVQIDENVRQISEKKNEPVARRTRSSSRAKRQKIEEESSESENQDSYVSKSFDPENSNEPLRDYQIAVDDQIVIDTRAIEPVSISLEEMLKEKVEYQIGDRVIAMSHDGPITLEIVDIFYSYGSTTVQYYARENDRSEMMYFSKDAIIRPCTKDEVSQHQELSREQLIESSNHLQDEILCENNNQNSKHSQEEALVCEEKSNSSKHSQEEVLVCEEKSDSSKHSQEEVLACEEKIDSSKHSQEESLACEEKSDSSKHSQEEALVCEEKSDSSKHSQDKDEKIIGQEKRDTLKSNNVYQRFLIENKKALQEFRSFLRPKCDNEDFGRRIGSCIHAIEKKTRRPHSIIEEIIKFKKIGLEYQDLEFENRCKIMKECEICKIVKPTSELSEYNVRVCENCLGITRAYFNLSFTLSNLKDCSSRNFSDKEIVYFSRSISKGLKQLEKSMRE